MLQVQWVKCGTDWCPFETVNLTNVTAIGVYIIWHDENPARTVRVGQGDIKARLTAHRADSAITSYRRSGILRVTWAAVPAADRDGVERFLADQYSPLVGGAFPNAVPIPVNLVA